MVDMPDNAQRKTKKTDVLLQSDVTDSITVMGDNNQIDNYLGREVVIPSAEAVAYQRVAQKIQ
jgi:hypothetical protein